MPSPGSKTTVAFIAFSLPCCTCEPQAVLDTIDERDERRLDDAGRRSDGRPAVVSVAVTKPMIDQHARDRRGAFAAVDDANLVILELYVLDLGIRAGERLA